MPKTNPLNTIAVNNANEQNASIDSAHINNRELSDAELMRYTRQVLLDGWDIDAQTKLKSSCVVIVGAGGLGCPASEALARAGVGRIHLIDNDMIEVSNLQRQTLFITTDIGKPKARVAAQRLRQINELINVTYAVTRIDQDNIEHELSLLTCAIDNKQSKYEIKQDITVLSDLPLTSILLDCTDNFAIRDLLNQFSVRHGTPLLSASAIGFSGQLTLFEPAKQTGCYHCLFGNLSTAQIDTGEDANCVNSGVLTSTTVVMGALQANAALQYLGLGVNPLLGELLLWDGKQMQQRRMRYRADKNCPVCHADLQANLQ